MRPRLIGHKDKLMLQEEVDALLAFLDEAAESGLPMPLYVSTNRGRREKSRSRSERWHRFWAQSRLVVHILLQSGLRCDELRKLQVRDCDTGSRPFRILVRGGKKRRDDEIDAVLIPGDLADELKAWIAQHQLRATDPLIPSQRGRQVSRRWIYELAKAPMRQLQLNPKFATHHYRHRYATTLLQRTNGNLLFVQQQLRHRSLQPTSTYLHMSDYEEEALDAVDRMSLGGAQTSAEGTGFDRKGNDKLSLAMQLQQEKRRGRR